MSSHDRRSVGLALLSVFGIALFASGCAHVNQEELDSRLDQIRQEMQEGDDQNAREIQQLGTRLGDVESRLDGLERDLRALQEDFDVTVERLETAIRFSTPVHFAYDEAEVRSQDREVLDRFGSVVGEYYGGATITVEGFTDPAGSESYNQKLGKRRADSVKSYLTENAGLSADRIRTVSYGESADRLVAPDAQGPGEAGMQNRRVVLVVDFAPESSGSMAQGREGSTGS